MEIVESSPTIENATIRYSYNYGIYAELGIPTIAGTMFYSNNNYDLYFQDIAMGGGGVITGNTFTHGLSVSNSTEEWTFTFDSNIFYLNNNFPIRIVADYVDELVTTSSFSNLNTESHIEVSGGIISHDATWPSTLPYHIIDHLSVLGTDGADNVTALTIAPGTTLKFNQNRGIFVAYDNFNNTLGPGALTANGTIDNPILFTSNQDAPAPGDWYGIQFDDYSDDNLSVLDYCIIEYAGYNGATHINNSSPTIKNSVIRYNSAYGINILFGSPSIFQSSIYDNGTYGIFGGDPETIITAENNWWGDASGPYDPSAADGQHNPDGTGDNVTDYVDYTPWLASMTLLLDKDGDGLTDEEELSIYGTDPNLPDTDGDGIEDGDEIAYWGSNWNADYDNDGIMNILDIDSDNDGDSDGEEISNGTDPGVANSLRIGGTITGTKTLPINATGAPYFVTEDLIIAEAAILTIDAGVTLKFTSSARLDIQGTLLILGNEAEPVNFTLCRDNLGDDWNTILINSTSENSQFDHVVIDYDNDCTPPPTGPLHDPFIETP